MEAPAAAIRKDARLRARAARRRRFFNTDSVEGMRLRNDLYSRRQAELEPVELSEEGAQLAAEASLYLETVSLFRDSGAAPRYR